MPPIRPPTLVLEKRTPAACIIKSETPESGIRESPVRSALMRQGYLVRDQLLPTALFEQLNRAVTASWHNGDHWRTLARLSLKTQIMHRQNQDAVQKIKALLQQKSQTAHFRYLYHALHQDQDDTGLIRDIQSAVTSAWSHEIGAIIKHYTRTDFSLTAFTPGCFLDRHTDYHHQGKTEKGSYQLTLLLYFKAPHQDKTPEKNDYGNDLCFDYFGKQHIITAKPNRSVLFVPSPETHHWVPEITAADSEASNARLAFSGWLI